MPIRFGVFEVDVASGELRKQGVRIKLQEQSFRALQALIEHPREVLSREELQKRIWSAGTVVDFDTGLNKIINRLRDALGDNAENPQFIETLPQRGYRFLPQVETVPTETPAPAPQPEVPRIDVRPARRRWLWLILAAGLLTLVVVAVLVLSVHQAPIRSIAVLPLTNLSGDPAREYFSDGLTDELIGEIARIHSLRVISRTSIMQYKTGARKSLPAIARELDVDSILEGTVVQAGQKVRITAQLIRARDDRHLWSEEYERDISDILALQGDVARAIASKIRLVLSPGEQMGLVRTRRVNPQAYDAYLKGNFFLHRGIGGISRAITFFQEAIRLDPSQAEAHAGLAEALCFAGIFGLRSPAETYPEARLAAQKALDIDESNAAAHNALGDVKQGYDWDLPGAEKEFQRAVQLNPSHLLTRLWYGECLTRSGRYSEAIEQSDRAVALDPVSPMSHGNRAMLFFRARRYDEAIRASEEALDLDPNFVNALWWQSLSYAGKGDFPKALAGLTKAAGMNEGSVFRGLLGYVSARTGDRPKALAILDELTARATQRFVSPMDFAVVYAGLGDTEATFTWLEKAYQAHDVGLRGLATLCFDNVRTDPRYPDLMLRVGSPR